MGVWCESGKGEGEEGDTRMRARRRWGSSLHTRGEELSTLLCSFVHVFDEVKQDISSWYICHAVQMCTLYVKRTLLTC